MIEFKKCKGTGKAIGNGCQTLTKAKTLKFGLCYNCYRDWLVNTSNGSDYANKIMLRVRKKVFAEIRKKDRETSRELNTSKAMSLADRYFSRYIRLLFSHDGLCTCYTCGTITLVNECDCGHYMKREHKGTRYLIDNCRPQCKTCNGDTKHNGKQIEFRDGLVREIGLEMVEQIEMLSKKDIKADSHFYIQIAHEFRIKLNELQKELNVKYW